MFIYINVINKKYKTDAKWEHINSKFRSVEKWIPGKKKLKDIDIDKQEAFVLFIATLYKTKLVQIVEQRRWEKYWIPLSKNYLNHKRRKGYFTQIWMRTKLLIDSISIWYDKKREKVVIGIPDNVYYIDKQRDIKLPVIVVAKWMEYGTTKMPPRPLFRRLQTSISKRIGDYYREFDKLYEENEFD